MSGENESYAGVFPREEVTGGELSVNLSIIPQNWFLAVLFDARTPIIYKGDQHHHIAWVAKIQHIKGGKEQRGEGKTPQIALIEAVKLAQ